jgi:hypothetical protein
MKMDSGMRKVRDYQFYVDSMQNRSSMHRVSLCVCSMKNGGLFRARMNLRPDYYMCQSAQISDISG